MADRAKSAKKEFRVLSTTAILGYGFPEASFRAGLAKKPDLIGADAGSTDPGPYYLGAGKSFTDRSAVKRDLRFMLKAGVERGIPVVVGTAGGMDDPGQPGDDIGGVRTEVDVESDQLRGDDGHGFP